MGVYGDAFSRALSNYHFRQGGRIYDFRGADSVMAPDPEVIDRFRRENPTAFKKGGKIRKGSIAMKRKMAKLRAMKKRRV